MTEISDNSDYDEDYVFEDLSDEDSSYDDLYDDYDAWDIENPDPEFNLDEESPMFEFDPFAQYFDLKDESDNVMMTYQALGELSEMTSRLLQAWEKRSKTAHSERPEPDLSEVCLQYQNLVHLYQLEEEERRNLRANSVWMLKRLLGGQEEVMRLKEAVDNIFIFSKRIILAILESSLPRPMPYPVMNTILSYLLPVKGAGNIGLVSNDEEAKVVERKDLAELYLALAEVHDHVQMIMFSTDPLVYEPSNMNEKKTILVEKFEIMVATVNNFQLQLGFEGLGIEEIEAGEMGK